MGLQSSQAPVLETSASVKSGLCKHVCTPCTSTRTIFLSSTCKPLTLNRVYGTVRLPEGGFHSGTCHDIPLYNFKSRFLFHGLYSAWHTVGTQQSNLNLGPKFLNPWSYSKNVRVCRDGKQHGREMDFGFFWLTRVVGRERPDNKQEISCSLL